jgi:hypothetical protein
MAVMPLIIWYWMKRIPLLAGFPCPLYGFLFTTPRSSNDGWRISHIIFGSLLLAVIAVVSIFRLFQDEEQEEDSCKRNGFLPGSVRYVSVITNLEFLVFDNVIKSEAAQFL